MSSMAKLGALMFVALVILGFFIMRIEQLQLGGDEDRTRIRAVFDSVAGLNPKSAVRIAGVRVGLVEEIGLEDGEAIVTIALDEGVALRAGAAARIRSLGLLGETYVELDPGMPRGAILEEGALIEGQTMTSFDDILDSADRLGADLERVTESLGNTIGGAEGEARIDEILENIRQLTREVSLLVKDNRDEVSRTLANFEQFSETLNERTPDIAERIEALATRLDRLIERNEDDISGAISEVRQLAADLRESAQNVGSITAKIDRGEGTMGRLVNDESTVDKLNDTLDSVRAGADTLGETIGRPARWRLEMGVQSEMLPGVEDDNDSRSRFGFDLYTTERRFFRVGLVDSPLGDLEVTNEVITRTENGVTTTTVIEKEKRSDDFTFDAQVGFRILDDTTLRAGLIESEGGVGVDQWLFEDRLGLTLDAYDFDRVEDAPRLRFVARWNVTENIFAYTGWDDPVASDRSSVIIGAGIRWTDEDFKYLLGTAAAGL